MSNDKIRLLWIDTEFTNLDDTGRLVEIAAVVTDGNLKELDAFESVVMKLDDDGFGTLSDWCLETFAKNGLLGKIRASKVSVKEVELCLLDWLWTFRHTDKFYLAGNSVYNDMNVLKREMPKLVEKLHYRLADVSALKLFLPMMFPDTAWQFEKTNNHTAMSDIRESIAEYKFYRSRLRELDDLVSDDAYREAFNRRY